MASIATYLKAARPFSFTASATSALFGSAAAFYHFSARDGFQFNVISCILVVIGCISIHIVSNLLNTYYDERSGLDRMPEAAGADNAIVNGLMTPKQVLGEALFFFLLAAAIGVYFVLLCGTIIIALILFGALSAWAYTAPPFKLKYRGLGDIQVILSFGILMITGAYATQTYYIAVHSDYVKAVLMSLPLSFLVAAILHANNHRDREIDIRYGAKTLATRMSNKTSIRFFKLLLFAAYFITLVLVMRKMMPYWVFPVIFFTVPLSIKAAYKLAHREQYSNEIYNVITADTAKIHLIFGLLSIIILIVSSL